MAGTEFSVLDSDELRPFHRKVTLLSAAGMFLDGYDLAVIAVALPVLKKQWDISPGWEEGDGRSRTRQVRNSIDIPNS